MTIQLTKEQSAKILKLTGYNADAIVKTPGRVTAITKDGLEQHVILSRYLIFIGIF
jgi:hypothetical protein